MKRAVAGIGLAACLAPAVGAEAPICAITASAEPAEAFAGQQVEYRLRIESREDVRSVEWVEPPAFPGFRAEWLPGNPSAGSIRRNGAIYRAREERRALFPQRRGSLPVRPPDLRCATSTGTQLAAVPEVAVRAVLLPEDGRPPDFSGVAAPVAVQVFVAPRSVALGGSVRVGVTLRSDGNLWDAPDPLAPDAFSDAGAEVFRRRPQQQLDAGRVLSVRRIFAYDVVPRREGVLTIPEIRVSYFDPRAGAYGVTRSETVDVEVTPRPAASAGASPPPGAATGEPAVQPGPGASRWLLAAAGVCAAGLGAAFLRRRARRDGRALSHLAEAREARARGDREAEATALGRALRAALEIEVDDAANRSAEEFAARVRSPAAREAAQILAAVERSRFDPGAPAPDPAAVERALSRLGR